MSKQFFEPIDKFVMAYENGFQEIFQRILLLSAWYKADIFTDEEKIILEIIEEVTMIHLNGLSPKTYQKGIEIFDQNYFSMISMAITTLNSRN